MHVLVVDDNPDDVDRFQRIAASEGWTIAAASSAAQGLVAAQTTSFDLIVLDYDLGDGFGTDLESAIRGLGIQTPILLQTGHPAAPVREGHAFSSFLNKNSPKYRDELVSRARRAAASPSDVPRHDLGSNWSHVHGILESLVAEGGYACVGLANQRSTTTVQVVSSKRARAETVETVMRVAAQAAELLGLMDRVLASTLVFEIERTTVVLRRVAREAVLVAAPQEPAPSMEDRQTLEKASGSLARLIATRGGGSGP